MSVQPLPIAAVPEPEVFTGFSSASRAVINHLRDLLGLDLWMVTRAEGRDWIILEATENSYGITPGAVLPWEDTFCSRMAEGAPNVAPRAQDVDAYRRAPIGRRFEIGSYVGLPLTGADGNLFGTLCAIDPSPQPGDLLASSDTVALFAKLLGTILGQELAAQANLRSLEIAEAAALTDALTGLPNRRAWDGFVEREEARCRRFGHPAAVVMIDINGLKQVNDTQGHAAGDDLLRRAGEALQRTVRTSDLAARLGGDEFAVLATESDDAVGRALGGRLRKALARAGVEVSVGTATRRPDQTLVEAARRADAAMYAAKLASR